jgi:hypothetical protein
MHLIDELFPATLPTLISRHKVRRILNASSHLIDNMVADGRLPRPLRLGRIKAMFSTEQVRQHLRRLQQGGAR